jgi:hypothetical protein
MSPCSDSITSDMEVELGCVGLYDPENNKFDASVQPNPNNGTFFVNVAGASDQDVSITVIDMMGKEIFRNTSRAASSSVTRKIDLSGAGKGTYIIKVNTATDQKIEKIIIR